MASRPQKILFQVCDLKNEYYQVNIPGMEMELEFPSHTKVIEAITEYFRVVWDLGLSKEALPLMNVAWGKEWIYVDKQAGRTEELMGNFEDRLKIENDFVVEQQGNYLMEWLDNDSMNDSEAIIYYLHGSDETLNCGNDLKEVSENRNIQIRMRFVSVTGNNSIKHEQIQRMEKLEMERHNTTYQLISDQMFKFVKADCRLVTIRVHDIPMKSGKKNQSQSYSVDLFCASTYFQLTEDMSGKRSDELDFHWIRKDSDSNIQNQFLIRDSFPLTPLKPNEKRSRCLMMFLQKQKAATISLNKNGNHGNLTHMLLKHGNQVFIKCIKKESEMYIPILHLKKTKFDYRESQLLTLIREHNMVRCTNNPTTKSMEELIRQHFVTILPSEGSPSYFSPREVERVTRVFPLENIEGSYLFKDSLQGPVQSFFKSLIGYVTCKALAPVEVQRCSKLIQTLYDHLVDNDPEFIPQYEDDHTERYHAYRSVWGDIRNCVKHHNRTEILQIMDDIFPNFFYEPETSSDKKSKIKETQVARDRYGKPIFPLTLGALKVHSLGVVDYKRENYHTEKYIWPIGYKASRTYSSVKDVSKRIRYTCEIQEGGDHPCWVLTSSEDPHHPIREKSATAAWTVIVKRVNEIKTNNAGKRVYTNVSGPEYYGLAHRTIQRLISELPNAEKVYRPLASFPSVYQPKPPRKDNDEFNSVFESSDNHQESSNSQERKVNFHQKRMNTMITKNHQMQMSIDQILWTENQNYYDLLKLKNEQLTQTNSLPGENKPLYSSL